MKKRRRQTPARRLYVAEDNLGKYIKIRDIQDVFGWNLGFCKNFLAAMAALDRDYEKGVETFSSFALKGLRKIHKLPVVTVKSLDDSWIFRGFGALRGFLRDEIYIKKSSAYVQATSLVLLDGRYKDKPCIVKLLQQVNPQELIVETLINMFMERNTADIPEIDSPKVYALCKATETRRTVVLEDKKKVDIKTFKGSPRRDWVLDNLKSKPLEDNDILLVQEKIAGSTFNRIGSLSTLKLALTTLCKGLEKLQRKFSFSHRDFHADNVMYSKQNNKAYIIDFGWSCFSVPQTDSSLQAFRGGFGWDQCTEDGIRKCKNRSHDLCTLLLSLYWQVENTNTDRRWFLEPICADICAGYYKKLNREKIKEMKKRFDDKIKSTPMLVINKRKGNIFHYYYTYLMYDIELEDFIPSNVVKRLEASVKKIKF